VYQLAGTDPKAANSFESPNLITSVAVAAPSVSDKTATLTLPPLSFTAIDARLK
jgi:alpha-L-arabinofuranosidase